MIEFVQPGEVVDALVEALFSNHATRWWLELWEDARFDLALAAAADIGILDRRVFEGWREEN